MGQFGIGQSVKRTEDVRFLRGHGQYMDDINRPRQTYAVFVRSPHAHARITAIDTREAEAAPGVLAVATAADLAADGVGPIPCLIPLVGKDGTPLKAPPRPALAEGRARHVGDAVAAVIAETLDQARDAAELVEVDYDEMDAAADTAAALDKGAGQVWDEAPNNLCFDWERGDKAATQAAFDKAARVISVDLVNNRLIPNPIEPRAAIGEWDEISSRYVLYASTQGGHGLRRTLTSGPFPGHETDMRVVTPDVGGGFGMKIFVFPEQVVALWAAKKLGRPVKWTSERAEGLLSDTHGRDNVTHAELALDAGNRFLAVKVATIANMGAYLSNFAPFIATDAGVGMLPGVYDIPAVYSEVKGVFTNTVPVDAYRGAGRPEAIYVIERLVDAAARETGMDPAELRRLNYIKPEAMPYTTAMGLAYDSGDFAALMDAAMTRADHAGFEARRAAAREVGKLRGIGMAYYIEVCGGGMEERASVRIEPKGGVTVTVGSQNNGQGHETAYAQLVEERLGVPFENIRVFQGDTDIVGFGRGTGGSRALAVGGNAVIAASEKVIEKAKRIAAHKLEAAEADLEYADGEFVIAGTDRRMTMLEVAAAAFQMGGLPKGMEPGLDEMAYYSPAGSTFPNGCHVCEIEVDIDTGAPRIVNYVVVDDFGNLINPMLVEGQVHGGIAQGVGQALLEQAVYDDGGQLLTGSFMDYAMPRADDFPDIHFETRNIPCATNPLGVKGAGEAGAIGAPPAVIHALLDALAEYGVTSIDMPATPETLWRLIHRAEASA
ncbi:MAG TPA: xanthine dehydrogenase family protein molybdopterin-binding subunit [Alphaproteobacteria bacterium]|nr:xanthine dehydrogenase family protein molybdopterin-binding subunit [Alphaproteobacteria bacterium]